MLKILQILVSPGFQAAPRGVHVLAIALLTATLSGCGQPGALYLPTEPEAARRATLPQTILPQIVLPASPATPPAQEAPKQTAPANRTAPQ